MPLPLFTLLLALDSSHAADPVELTREELAVRLDSLDPGTKSTLLRVAALRDLEESGLDPKQPDLLVRLGEQHRLASQSRSLEDQRRAFYVSLEADDYEQAELLLGEAEALGASAAELAPLRRELSRTRVLARLWSLTSVAAPFVLPLLPLAMGLALWRRATPQRAALPPRFNPYLAGRPVRDPALFFGRAELMRDVHERLRLRRAVLLSGERRIGKTSMLLQIARGWREAGGLDIYVDLEGSRARGPENALITALAREATRLGLDTSGDAAALAGRLAARAGTLLLALDEVDVLSGLPEEEGARLLAALFQPERGVVSVMAGVDVSFAAPRLAEIWRREVDEVTVPPLNEEGARTLLLEPAHGLLRFDDAVVGEVLRRAQGRPMRVQLFGLHLMDRLNVLDRRQAGAEDLRAVIPAVEHAWSAIQEAGLAEQEAPAEIDAAIYEIARLKQEIQLLERELEEVL